MQSANRFYFYSIALLFAIWPEIALAQSPSDPVRAAAAPSTAPAATDTKSADTIAPGTVITMSNWQSYKQFMPDGMVALFEGKYFWKIPPDVRIEIGPTVIHPLPKSYLAASEANAGNVKIIETADGGLTLTGYRGGLPFPNADEPHKGWKVLANLWYRYLPHLIVDSYGAGCGVNSMGAAQCFGYQVVVNQLSFNTDPGVAAEVAGSGGKFITEWFMFVEPEQDKYEATLTIDYADPTRAEDLYAFVPALRRYQPISTAARCSPTPGTDAVPEDFRYGFDSNITQMNADYIGRRRIIALLEANAPNDQIPQGFAMPLGWPTPAWGKWQVRDVDVISAKKIPSRARGYCYGNRVMYVDRQFNGPLWEDLYDARMAPWKYYMLVPRTIDVPGIGPVDQSGSDVEMIWDIQNNHMTLSADPALGRPFYNNQAAPGEYLDLERYTTPGGLNLIMR